MVTRARGTLEPRVVGCPQPRVIGSSACDEDSYAGPGDRIGKEKDGEEAE